VNNDTGERILVLAPTGRDSSAACALLEHAGLSCKPCSGIGDLRIQLEAGAGAGIISEEAFFGTDPAPLFDWVRDQPPCRRKIEMSPGVQSRDDIPVWPRSASLPASRSGVEQRNLIGSLDWIWATVVGDW
jgi:hypothetical protein